MAEQVSRDIDIRVMEEAPWGELRMVHNTPPQTKAIAIRPTLEDGTPAPWGNELVSRPTTAEELIQQLAVMREESAHKHRQLVKLALTLISVLGSAITYFLTYLL